MKRNAILILEKIVEMVESRRPVRKVNLKGELKPIVNFDDMLRNLEMSGYIIIDNGGITLDDSGRKAVKKYYYVKNLGFIEKVNYYIKENLLAIISVLSLIISISSVIIHKN